MKPSARILGALTLAAVLAATMIIVAPTRFPQFEHWLAAKAARQSNTPTDPPCSTVIQWVRKFSRERRGKIEWAWIFCPSGVPTSRRF